MISLISANKSINLKKDAYYRGAIAMEAGFNASKYKRDKFIK